MKSPAPRFFAPFSGAVASILFFASTPGGFAAKPSTPPALRAGNEDEPGTDSTKSVVPLTLGPATPEGFDDPEHVHFFRYQLYLRNAALEGLDGSAWAKLSQDERRSKIKAGESFLRDKFTALVSNAQVSSADSNFLDAIWGKDARKAVVAIGVAAGVGDPAQIRAAREKVQKLISGVGTARLDWASIFDGAAPGTVAAPSLPDPLALKKEGGFLASLKSKEVQAPLQSKATFVQFLHSKQVPPDALPAMTALYEVLEKAVGPEKAETAHLLPTIVRFLQDGKKIDHEEAAGALAFAVPGKFDAPERVGITSSVSGSDPVLVASVLSHEFQHIYDMYAGRYYSLDSELRGFKSNVMFNNIMSKDPVLRKKLEELKNGDDITTRTELNAFAKMSQSLAEDPQKFAQLVYFRYTTINQGQFDGRLTLRQAVDPQTGLQTLIASAQTTIVMWQQMGGAARVRLAEARARSASLNKDVAVRKALDDVEVSSRNEQTLQAKLDVAMLQLDRMQREAAWMDRRAAASGAAPPPYDLSLPVDPDYILAND